MHVCMLFNSQNGHTPAGICGEAVWNTWFRWKGSWEKLRRTQHGIVHKSVSSITCCFWCMCC